MSSRQAAARDLAMSHQRRARQGANSSLCGYARSSPRYLTPFLLDTLKFTLRMRPPMHPNYRKSFARTASAALRQSLILSNRRGVPACALRDAGEPDVLMR